MNGRRSISEDAGWDAMNERCMHPFTEKAVIESLERLFFAIVSWHTLRHDKEAADADLVRCGHELVDAIPQAVLAFRNTQQRRRKELAAEYRVLAKPAMHRE
jgi:hypothetical protein